MTSHDDLPNRLKNAKRRARRRQARAQATGPERLDLREVAPDLPLRLYDRPVALPDPGQPAVCPGCGRELVCFDHRDKAMLMCEPCCRLWPTDSPSSTHLRSIVRRILPLAAIRLRRVGNEQDYNRVYYAAHRERLLAQRHDWLEGLPEQGARYRRAYYQANREKILTRQLAHYHANKAEKKARQAEYRRKNRAKERARQRRWKAENPEKHRAQQRAYYQAHRERIAAQRKARKARSAGDPQSEQS